MIQHYSDCKETAVLMHYPVKILCRPNVIRSRGRSFGALQLRFSTHPM